MKLGPREISFFALLSKPICFCDSSLSRAQEISFMDSCTALYMAAIWVIVVKMLRETPHLRITSVYRTWLPIILTNFTTSEPISCSQAPSPILERASLYLYEKLLLKITFYQDMSVWFYCISNTLDYPL